MKDWAGRRYIPVHMPLPWLRGDWVLYDQDENRVVGRAMTREDAMRRAHARNLATVTYNKALEGPDVA